MTGLRTALAALAGVALLAAAPPRPPREGYVPASDGVRLYYRVVGAGPDTLIAIHGGPGVDLESIAADFAPLAAHHTVIFYDQRGAGRSTLPRDTTVLTAARQVDDLDAVRRYFGLARVTLVAHSYGPLLAASYAVAHPAEVRRMVFFGAVPPARGALWQRMGATMAARLDSAQGAAMGAADRRMNAPGASGEEIRAGCRAYWAVALRPRLADPDRSLPLVRSDLCASDPAGIRYGLATTNRLVMNSYGAWDLTPQLGAVAAPTLVVHGEEDAIPIDLVARWATALPHATLLRVPRAGHFPYVEQPALVWPAVERFLAGRDTTAPNPINPPNASTSAAPAQTPDEVRLHTDWANLARYRDANAALPAPAPGERRVVFLGNSITEGWARYFPAQFPGRPYVNRGIGGQTTPQMLVRFRQDVVALRPAAVVILAGTNDIAGNTGPSTLAMIEDNLRSMTEVARANGIRVVLSSVLPVYDYPWHRGLEPAPKIVALNAWMRDYAARAGAVYLDYHTPMADARQGMRAELTTDGVHVNEAGYRLMAPLAERAIAEALR